MKDVEETEGADSAAGKELFNMEENKHGFET